MSEFEKAARQALEALDCIYSPLHVREINKVGAAMTALRQALEQADQFRDATKMMATAEESSDVEQQPAAPAIPLTREQVKGLCELAGYDTASMQERADFINGIRHAESAHGIAATPEK